MRTSTQVILFMLVLLISGFILILFSEFIREGSIDTESIRHIITKADMKVEDAIQRILNFFE